FGPRGFGAAARPAARSGRRQSGGLVPLAHRRSLAGQRCQRRLRHSRAAGRGMTVNCQQVAQEVGSGVAAALRAVDCTAGNLTAQAFGRLFAPGGSMATVLTILLTIYIAIFGIQLLTG